jgi:predicted molibdopterin-dependent oxidoreductase YjgC
MIRDVLQHSGSMSTRSKSLDLVVSEAYLEINEEDATKLGVSDNSHVKVSSRRGTVYLKAKITDAVPAGMVFTSTHFPHGRVNTLLYYPENGTSSPCAVKVESAKG